MLSYSRELRITPDPTPTLGLIPPGSYVGAEIEGARELSAEAARGVCRDETPRKRALTSQLLIDTPHDGQLIPRPFWENMRERADDPSALEALIESRYRVERDWGASLVADAVGVALRMRGYPLEGHYRAHIARVLLDFARFPGSTPRDADHLSRFAINYPSSEYLSHTHKQLLLERHYDRQSTLLESFVESTRVNLSIHTYDTRSANGTLRPCVSVINRPISYQLESQMPFGSFDPLYPAELLEHTADRKLTYRLTLAFEEAGMSASHNYPYLLPNGSVEVRSQVWRFFQFLRARFEAEHPETRDLTPYRRVWDLLLDTNLRSTQSEDLRSYLHMFRRAPEHLTADYEAARAAYEEVKRFFKKSRESLLGAYRADPWRLSSFVLEVRKDCIWRFKDESCREPLEPRYDQIALIAEIVAETLINYLERSPEVVVERALRALES